MIEENKYTTEQLQRCICAKKQAMQLFDYWYWQQLQTETKVERSYFFDSSRENAVTRPTAGTLSTTPGFAQATLSTLFHSQTQDLDIVVAPTPERPIRTLPRASIDQSAGDRITAYLGPGREGERRDSGRSSRLSKSVAFDGERSCGRCELEKDALGGLPSHCGRPCRNWAAGPGRSAVFDGKLECARAPSRHRCAVQHQPTPAQRQPDRQERAPAGPFAESLPKKGWS